jgi:signal peptidase I
MNFALIMLLLLVFTGGFWLLDKLVLRKRRGEGEPMPWWVEYPVSFFPVILVVFMLRSFLVEPFKIPSGSMIPTLLVGDYILVNKFTYGIRLPVANRKIVQMNDPKRGDVMVFRFPENPSLDYIKRVVGVPGMSSSIATSASTVNSQLVDVETSPTTAPGVRRTQLHHRGAIARSSGSGAFHDREPRCAVGAAGGRPLVPPPRKLRIQ